MQVVEEEDERRRLRELLEERAHGPVDAVALVEHGRRSVARARRERGEDPRELRRVAALEPLGVERAQVLVEGVHEDPVREIALELGGASREDEPLALLASRRQLGQEPRLADARLAGDLEHGGAARLDVVERALDERHLLRPPYQPVGLFGHP